MNGSASKNRAGSWKSAGRRRQVEELPEDQRQDDEEGDGLEHPRQPVAGVVVQAAGSPAMPPKNVSVQKWWYAAQCSETR